MNDDWDRISLPTLVTAKQMVYLILALEVVIQIIFLALAHVSDMEAFSIDWWILQFNGLVVATNIGAVVLAILAQKTANDIGAVQSRVLTGDFYRTIQTVTDLKVAVETEAASEGRSLDEEIGDLAPHLYSMLRAYLVSRQLEPLPAPDTADLGVAPAPEEPPGGWSDEHLFGSD
jgi:NADH:ubiquinone oxidoreductase subunit K